MVSKGLYHNFYGPLAAAPVPGPGVPNPTGGDLYYNTVSNLIYYWDAGAAAWVPINPSGVDIRDSRFIVGNVANGDVAGVNVDFAGNSVAPLVHALQQALNAMNVAVFKGGQVHVREGNYSGVPAAGNDAVPAPTGANDSPFYIPAAMAENVIIEGDGAVTFVNSVGNNNAVFVLVHPTAGKTITLKGVFVTGNGTNPGGTIEVGNMGTLSGSWVAGPNVTLENVKVNANNDIWGIVLVDNATPLSGADHFRGVNLDVFGAKGTANIMVAPNLTGYQTLDCIFDKCSVHGGLGASTSGFQANNCDNLKVQGSFAYNNKGSGIYYKGCLRSEITSCYAFGNVLNAINSSAGIYLESGVDIALANNEANSNALAAGGGDNFLLKSCQSVTVVGCIANNTEVGFAQPNNGFHAMLSNFVTFDACYASNAMTDGVANGMGYLAESCTYSVFNDCSALNNANYGIKLGLAAALCTRCQIVAGVYKTNGGGLGGIYDPEVYDFSGATTTNELAHFQWI
jgi:hypothetical protein